MPLAWRSELEAMLDAELRDGAVDDPFRPAVLRWAASTRRPADHDAVLSGLERMVAGGRGARRFRWRLPVGRWIPVDRLVRWRPAEREAAERHPNEHASRLWLAPILVEHLAWLEELAAGDDPRLAARARHIADEALPAIEDVVAQTVAGADPWADTFLLWSFARTPRALKPVRGLVVALAARYAARATRSAGVVRGRAFPFFELAMPSATAHLATASATLGEGMRWVDEQLAYLDAERRRDGGWGDPLQESDVLTTLAAARLFGTIDPAFDPISAVEPLRAAVARNGNGRPELIGPEWPWMAVELVEYLAWAELPFTERFRWPNVPDSAIDPRVDVPRFEGYLMLADLFERVPALRDRGVDVAFLDLANFGAWNTRHGMERGDELLALLTRHLRAVPRSRTFRDGGDEFLVVGSPGSDTLEADLCRSFEEWPAVCRGVFPGLEVVPLRAVISRERASELRAARERQGRWIGPLKHDFGRPRDAGVIRRYEGAADGSWGSRDLSRLPES